MKSLSLLLPICLCCACHSLHASTPPVTGAKGERWQELAEQYDYVYDQVERKSEKAKQYHKKAIPAGIKTQTRQLNKLLHYLLIKEERRQRHQGYQIVGELQRKIGRTISETLAHYGLAPEDVSISIHLTRQQPL